MLISHRMLLAEGWYAVAVYALCVLYSRTCGKGYLPCQGRGQGFKSLCLLNITSLLDAMYSVDTTHKEHGWHVVLPGFQGYKSVLQLSVHWSKA